MSASGGAEGAGRWKSSAVQVSGRPGLEEHDPKCLKSCMQPNQGSDKEPGLLNGVLLGTRSIFRLKYAALTKLAGYIIGPLYKGTLRSRVGNSLLGSHSLFRLLNLIEPTRLRPHQESCNSFDDCKKNATWLVTGLAGCLDFRHSLEAKPEIRKARNP